MNKNKIIPYLKTLAALLIIGIHVAPFYILINMSLKAPTERTSRWIPATKLYIENYINAIETGNLIRAVTNTLFIVVCSVMIIVVVGAMAAYPLSRKTSKRNKLILSFIVGVMMVPQLSILVPLYKELVAIGGINQYWGIIIVSATFNLPMAIYMYTNFIGTIPTEMDEAAMIDGCNRMQVFFHIILAWKERRAVQWKLCLSLAALVIAGSIPGILFLKNMDSGMIKIAFGIVIILLGLEMLLREFHPVHIKESRAALLLIGVLSGILCGLYGVGALLGAYLGRVTDDSSSFKATICIVFLFENTLRVVLYAVWGILNLDLMKQAVNLVPFMLIGLCLGMKSSKILDEKVVKKIVIGMLMVSGMALVWNNI